MTPIRTVGTIENVTCFKADGQGPFLVTIAVTAFLHPSPDWPRTRINIQPLVGMPEVDGWVFTVEQAVQFAALITEATALVAQVEREHYEQRVKHNTLDELKAHLLKSVRDTTAEIGKPPSKAMEDFKAAVDALPDLTLARKLSPSVSQFIEREFARLPAAP